MPDPGPILTRASAAALALSLLTLYLALRGRRIDTHPLCRKCKFDLFGLPPEHPHCPECGRDLTRRRARRIGNRRQIRWAARLGILLLFSSTGWLTFVGVRWARGVNVYSYKSVAWLIRDTRSDGSRDAAFDEIEKRFKRGTLRGNEERRLIEAALAHQADRAQKWIPQWGQFIESARLRKRLSEADWSRYLANACAHYEMQVRPVIRRGAVLPVRIRTLPERTASPARRFSYSSFPTFLVHGRPVAQIDRTGTIERAGPFGLPRAGEEMDVWLNLDPGQLLELNDGEHPVEAIVRVTQWDNVENPRTKALDDRAGVKTDVRVRQTWRLWTSDEPTVDRRDDPNLVPVMDAGLAVTVSQLWSKELNVRLDTASLPVDLAFDGLLRVGDHQYPLGWIVLRAGRTNSLTLPVALEGGPAGLIDKVDVRLSPNFDAAEYTVDVKQVWNVPVLRTNLRVRQGTGTP